MKFTRYNNPKRRGSSRATTEQQRENKMLNEIWWTEHYREQERRRAEQERIIKAMAAAGYYYDELESYTGYLRFTGAGFTINFNSWQSVQEWINGVVFDDPETSKAVDDILREA